MTVGVVVAVQDGGPSVFGDEQIYADNARAIAELRAYASAHYPPVYPIVLAAGLVLSGGSYLGMLLAGSVASALAVPAMWWLARSLELRHRWLPVALVALAPFQSVMAGYLLSENASPTVALLAVTLAVRGRRREAPWFGVSLAALHLTKYLFAPMVLVLLVTWWLRSGTDVRPPRRVRALLIALGSYLTPMALWVVYGLASGHRLPALFGLQIISSTAPRGAQEGTAAALGTWVTVYPAYLLLACLLACAVIVIEAAHRSPRRAPWRLALARLSSGRVAFAATIGTLVVGYVAVAVQHSLGAPYNHPVPDHPVPRYLVHLVPLVLALGALALEAVTMRGGARGPRLWLPTVGVLVAAWAAWGILYRGWVWGLPSWSLNRAFNAVDTFVLRDPARMALLSVAVVALAWLLRRPRVVVAALPWLVASAVVLATATVTVVSQSPAPGSRQQAIAHYLSDVRRAGHDQIELWVAPHSLSAATIQQSAVFWHPEHRGLLGSTAVDRDRAESLSSCGVEALDPASPQEIVHLLVTDAAPDGVAPVLVTGSGDGRVVVVALDPSCVAAALLDTPVTES